MPVKRYLDWRSWLEGLYKTWIEGVSSTVLLLVGSNTSDSMGLSDAVGAGHIGLNWKQAAGMLLSVTLVRAFTYIKAKPLPDVQTITTETTVKTVAQTTVTTNPPTTVP